jgi:ABC-2 type transport system ATP-binding protein
MVGYINMSDVIQVKNLVKRYNKADKNAVDDISFDVQAGEFFALLGPNGAGKTTTISILTTTLSKTSGTVKIAGFDIDRKASQVRQAVGIIFQNPSLDLNLTAEENIRFHTVLYGLYPFRPSFGLMPHVYKDKVIKLSQVLDIEKDMFRPIKTFSGGMKRKLEIMRSLMHSPKILFLDEPTTGLDPLSRRNVWEYLSQVRKSEKLTIFLTTHYLEEAENVDQVCIINKGKIVTLGKPQTIKHELTKEYLLIDSPQREKLKKELDKLKLKFTEAELIQIIVSASKMQQTIQSIKTPLSMIKTHTPTLEEAYLQIVEEKHD